MKKIVLMTVFTVSCILCSCGNKTTHNNDSVSVDTIIADSVE